MKNLLIYINPSRHFTKEHETLTKIQIDNSQKLGWDPKDIILVTNFPYNYKNISSIIVSDYEAFDAHRSTKIAAINQLFHDKLIQDDIYWFHDHDAFQTKAFTVDLNADAGFTNHGAWSKTWNAGSFFFKHSARDIFTWIQEYMDLRGTNEQNALTHMWENNVNDINSRYQLLDQSFNIGIYKIEENLKKSGADIKVAHFHPHKKHHLDLFRKHLPAQLLALFSQYGIN